MTVNQALGYEEVKILQDQGRSDDEIKTLARERLKNPPQSITQIPQAQELPADDGVPAWYKGQSDSGLANFAGDFLREAGTTSLNYANILPLGEDYHNYNTKILQKIEKIDEQNKAKNRTPERQAEVDVLQEKASKADGVLEKIGTGAESLYDTVINPQEWSAGGATAMLLDPANALYLGKTIFGALMLGAGVNSVQAGTFAANRTDKNADDVVAEAALGFGTGVALGGGVNLAGKGVGKIASKFKKDSPSVNENLKVEESGVEIKTESKVDKDGMLIDPFEVGDKNIKITPEQFRDELVDKKSMISFIEVFKNEEARVLEMDAKIKILGQEMEQRGATPQEIDAEIVKQFPPSPDAITISRILNDGQDMDLRILGTNTQQAIINSIQNATKSPEEFYRSMKSYGATHEHANAATRAYETKEIAVYTQWSLKKLAESKDMLVDMKTITDEATVIAVKRAGIDLDIQNISKGYTKDAQKHLGQLQKHERYGEVLDFSRDVDAKDSVNPQNLESPRKVTRVDGVNELKTTVEAATYSKNYTHDFQLSKAKVKRIEDGKATAQDIADLQADLKMLEENPEYAKTPHYELNEQIDADAAFGGERVAEHGPILYEHRGDYKGALNALVELQDGEAIGALYHKNIGPIDLVWGKAGTGKSDGYGLSKLVKYHPEVVENLDNIILNMDIVKTSANRMVLESKDHTAVVSLNWLEKEKSWLLSSYEKEASAHSSIDNVSNKSELATSNDAKLKDETLPNAKASSESLTPEALPSKDSISQNGKNGDDISKGYTKDIQNISMDTEIFVGKDANGNDIMVKYGDLEAELDAESAIIKRIEDCVL